MLLVGDWQRIQLISSSWFNCVMVGDALLLRILFHLCESAFVNTLNQFRSDRKNGVLLIIVQHLVTSKQFFLLVMLLDWELTDDFTRSEVNGILLRVVINRT